MKVIHLIINSAWIYFLKMHCVHKPQLTTTYRRRFNKKQTEKYNTLIWTNYSYYNNNTNATTPSISTLIIYFTLHSFFISIIHLKSLPRSRSNASYLPIFDCLFIVFNLTMKYKIWHMIKNISQLILLAFLYWLIISQVLLWILNFHLNEKQN